MEKQTVFIKRYPSKGELPKHGGHFLSSIGLVRFMISDKEWVDDYYRTRNPDWWLQEIELPSEEDIDKSGDDFAYPHIDSSFAFNCFMHGANFILNKLKGEAK